MREHRLEVADVFREHTEEFLELWGHTVSSQQRKALRDIGACRTAALGGHVEECDQCAHRLIAYNSCRNRHCPKCQSTARDQWLAERAKELLPVPYCHVVFTIPEQLAPLVCQNLLHHPHVHCVVPAGGLSPDGSRWIACRPKFFLPVRVLSRLFRGKLLALLRQAFAEGTLEFFGQLADLAEPARFHTWLRNSRKTEWVVYAKPPFGGPEAVLKC